MTILAAAVTLALVLLGYVAGYTEARRRLEGQMRQMRAAQAAVARYLQAEGAGQDPRGGAR